MKSYLSLIPISGRVHKRKNNMILTCIILAVFLVTAVFSMADMGVRMQKIRAYHDHGNWHILLQDIPKEQVEEIGRREEVAFAAWYDPLNYRLDKDYYINDKKTLVCGIGEDFTELYTGFTENAYPERNGEAILSSNLQNLIKIEIGDTLTLSTPAEDIVLTVSGFYDNSQNLMVNDAVGIFVNLETYGEILDINGEAGEPVCYIQFENHVNARKAVENIKTEYGLTEENIEENDMIFMLSRMSTDSVIVGFYGVAAVLFLLILAAGILMISGSINSSVAERTQFFGMLRCIGASRKQIIRFVKLEALNWCRLAVPVGVGMGIVITWVLCAILHNIVGGEFADIPVFGISAIGIVSGIIVGLLTVFLAAGVPAKRAAKVSPVAAVSGSMEDTQQDRRGADLRLGKIEAAMGIHHAVSAKKNLMLMTFSFALSIVLFLCFSAALDLVERVLPAVRVSAPDVSISSQDYSNTIDRELVMEAGEMPHVKRAFGRMYQGDVPADSEKGIESIDLISYEEHQFIWAEEDVLRGDVSKVFNGNFVLTDHSETNPLDVGDMLILNGQKMEVAALLASTPFESDDTPLIICSENTFTALTGENAYAIIDVQFSKDAVRSDIEAIRRLAGEENIFSDRWELNKDDVRLYWAFRLFVYGFLAIIALIAIVHIINSISMSVTAKLRQYGMLRAVGMSTKQMTRMITAEAVTYAVFGIIVGLAMGIPLHKWCYELLVTAHYGVSWQPPIVPVMIILLLMAVAASAAVYFPSKRMKRISIIDTIAGHD